MRMRAAWDNRLRLLFEAERGIHRKFICPQHSCNMHAISFEQ